MVDEETPLTGGGSQSGLGQKEFTLNIERLRFVGLVAVFVLLAVGAFVTKYAVVYPAKEDPSSFWAKLNGAPTDFVYTATYVFQLFGFNHTCSVLDFNPSKTISAIVVMFSSIPLDIFVICHYLRITSQTDKKYDGLKKVTGVLSAYQFIAFTYFYMVFVNSPDGVFDTPEGDMKFVLHYVPYMLWQLAILIMAVQQCWFISLKDAVPVPFTFVTPCLMWRYCQFLMVMFVVYTWFIWSFILGDPLWDTSTPFGELLAKCIMYTWDVVAILIPAIFAWYESTDGHDTKFIFMELQ